MTRVRGYDAAERHGHWAEMLSVLWLRLKLYRILARRWRGVGGELDIVAKRCNTVALIEVKARADRGVAAEAIGKRQRKRIADAARQFVAIHPALASCDLRFDIMLVVPGRPPIHVKNAWVDGD